MLKDWPFIAWEDGKVVPIIYATDDPGSEAPEYDEDEAVDEPVTPEPGEEPEPDIAPGEDEPTTSPEDV